MERKEKAMQKNLQEELLQAMRIVAKAEVDKVNFDKTIICTIKDNSNAENGEYYVTDGSSSFYAYTEVTTYTVGTQVYVMIPEGNYDNRKLIMGKYLSSDDEPYNYVSPSSLFIEKTINLITDGETERALLTNYQGTEFPPVSQKEINNDPASSSISISNQTIDVGSLKGYDYDCALLRADFKSLIRLGNPDMQPGSITGRYGLRLHIDLLDNDGNLGTIVAYLDTEHNMNGNPYDFETFYTQEMLVPIEEKYFSNGGLDIQAMSVEFFQAGADSTFTYQTLEGSKLVPWYLQIDPNEDKELLPPNLFVKNIVLKLGYQQEKENKDKVTIRPQPVNGGYGTEGQNPKALSYYSYLTDAEIQRLKNKGVIDSFIELYQDKFIREYNEKIIEIDNSRTYIDLVVRGIISENDVTYKLYQYVDPNTVEYPVSDEYAGDNWKEVDWNNDGTYRFDPDIGAKEQKFKTIAFYDDPLGTEEVLGPNGEIITPNTKHMRVSSAELVFTLVGVPQTPDTEYLTIDCSNNGIFKIYNLKGHLINSFSQNVKRFLYAHKENSDATLTSITWRIPYVDTMIDPISSDEFLGTSGEDGTKHFERKPDEGVYEYTIFNPKSTEFYFRIKDYLNPKAVNNTIVCWAKFNNSSQIEVAEKTIEFCTIEQHGTEYKIAANFFDGLNALTFGREQRVRVRVLDADNIDITPNLIEQGFKFNLEWYSKPPQSAIEYSDLNYGNGTEYQGIYSFLLGAAEDVPGGRITEDGQAYRVIEHDQMIRIIENLNSSSGESSNVRGTRSAPVLRAGSGSSPAMDYVSYRITNDGNMRSTDEGDIRVTNTSIMDVPDLDQYYGSHIIKISIFNYNGQTITGLFAVPFAISDVYSTYVGPTEILYDSAGANPAYYKSHPQLYYIDQATGEEEENTGIRWRLYSMSDNINSQFPEYELTSPDYLLQVPPMFVSGRKCINMVAEAPDGTQLWVQPIPISRDDWDNPVLNNWYDWTIQSISAGAAQRMANGSISGVFLGRIPDEARYSEYTAQQRALVEEINEVQNQYEDARIYYNYLIENGASQEEKAAQKAVVDALEAELADLNEDLAEINTLIDRCRFIIGLYGMYNGETFFKLTEEGRLTLGMEDEIQFSYNSGLIQSKNHSSIVLNLFENSFSLSSNGLSINPSASDGVVIRTNGMELYNNGLINANQLTVHQMSVNTSGEITAPKLTIDGTGENVKIVTPKIEITTAANAYAINAERIDVTSAAGHSGSGILRAVELQATKLSFDTTLQTTDKVIELGANHDFYIQHDGTAKLGHIDADSITSGAITCISNTIAIKQSSSSATTVFNVNPVGIVSATQLTLTDMQSGPPAQVTINGVTMNVIQIKAADPTTHTTQTYYVIGAVVPTPEPEEIEVEEDPIVFNP